MTFNITKLPRTMTRAQWEDFSRVLRSLGELDRSPDALTERAQLAADLRDCTVNGEIALVVSGMDCDCVQYCHSHIALCSGVIQFEKYCEEEYEWADGPKNVGFCKPADRPDNESRDLVMEAYEDGHPHSISAATV